MITWASVVLCVDSDLTDLESNALSWAGPAGAARYREAAKVKIIEPRLRHFFRELDYTITGSEVLDLIASVEPLRLAATYLSLHLLCNDCSSGGDLFAEKAVQYWTKYNEEWVLAVDRLSVDTDESGAIDSSEEYNQSAGVRFVR